MDGARNRPAVPAFLHRSRPDVADPEAVAERLPRGAGVVFRAFGAADAGPGLRLRAIADARGLILLVGADIALAEAIGADGVHLPERLRDAAPALRAAAGTADHPGRARRRRGAAGSTADIDALVVSPVFASNSPSAGTPLGVSGLKASLIVGVETPVYALGGGAGTNRSRLWIWAIVGIAAVEALARLPIIGKSFKSEI
jgi:thiamine-phosphate pyrophosphorylase